MSYPTQQDVIKRKLHSFDMQQSQNMAAQLGGTFRSNHFSLPKYHSFREISDWNDRYPVDKPFIHHQQSQQAEKHQQLPEFYRYAFLIYPEKRGNLKQSHSVSLKKEKCYLSPLKMEFLNGNSKKRSKKQTSLFDNEEGQRVKKPKYELNYEPLKKLYWLKTKKEQQKQEKSHKELPILLPTKEESMKFPKTERSSSILRVMKRNQKIREIRKNKNPQSSQLNMFIIPS